MELLYTGNENQIKLTGSELLAIKRFNRFVILIYLEAWFKCNSAIEAPVNDMKLLEKLRVYDDKDIGNIGIKWLTRHSWYLSPEIATLAIFSSQLTCSEKQLLINGMTDDRGPHLLKILPSSISVLCISRSFFDTTGIESDFLSVPVDQWCQMPSYNISLQEANNMSCCNDCAERGIALSENLTTLP